MILSHGRGVILLFSQAQTMLQLRHARAQNGILGTEPVILLL
jgi:hypothetical protein